jgi:hypothetical protein
MKVFAVYKMGEEDALGIFSTEEKADEFIRKDMVEGEYISDYSVAAYFLDGLKG